MKREFTFPAFNFIVAACFLTSKTSTSNPNQLSQDSLLLDPNLTQHTAVSVRQAIKASNPSMYPLSDLISLAITLMLTLLLPNISAHPLAFALLTGPPTALAHPFASGSTTINATSRQMSLDGPLDDCNTHEACRYRTFCPLRRVFASRTQFPGPWSQH